MNRRYFTLFLCSTILSYILGCAPWVDQLKRDADDEKTKIFFEKHTIYKIEDFNVNTSISEIIEPRYRKAVAIFPELKKPETRPDGPPVPKGTKKREMVFVHLSDVQIRDERVKLFGEGASRIFDNIIPSFEHGTDQEHYDYAAYLALIKTINALKENKNISEVEKPKFMVHTGDAVDASVVEELYEFIYISNKLEIPWYNVLGNHDVTVFGNFDNRKVYVNDPSLTFQTLHNEFNFINMHGEGHLKDPNVNVGPLDAEHRFVEITGSRFHGFDLYARKKNQFLCRYCPGYYSFKMRKENGDYKFVSPFEVNPPQKVQEIVFIVLDTTTTKLGFAKGIVDKDQLQWLESQLKENPGRLILAFGHHSLDSDNFLDNSYKDLIKLFHHHNVNAYFCGHTHVHEIRFHEKDGAKQGFWEIITDSIIEYPQEGSLVTIYNFGKGIGAIDVQSFRKNITNDCQLKREADLAFEDAENDHLKKCLFKDIDEKNRNVRLPFNHPYFAD